MRTLLLILAAFSVSASGSEMTKADRLNAYLVDYSADCWSFSYAYCPESGDGYVDAICRNSINSECEVCRADFSKCTKEIKKLLDGQID